MNNFLELSTNEFKIKKIDENKVNNFTTSLSFRSWNDRESMIINGEELASIFHIPSNLTSSQSVEWESEKKVAPPTSIPKEGLFLGDFSKRDGDVEIYIPDADRLRHLYMVGQTGTGKSTLIKGMAIQDIYNKKGLAVFDPNGDLIDDLAGLVPDDRKDDIIIFDPTDTSRSFSINMLEWNYERPEEKRLYSE